MLVRQLGDQDKDIAYTSGEYASREQWTLQVSRGESH